MIPLKLTNEQLVYYEYWVRQTEDASIALRHALCTRIKQCTAARDEAREATIHKLQAETQSQKTNQQHTITDGTQR